LSQSGQASGEDFFAPQLPFDQATFGVAGGLGLAGGLNVTYDDFFAKPPGTAARVSGTLSNDPNGWLAIDAWKFVMKDLDSRGKKNK
jgi:hypothetical protein